MKQGEIREEGRRRCDNWAIEIIFLMCWWIRFKDSIVCCNRMVIYRCFEKGSSAIQMRDREPMVGFPPRPLLDWHVFVGCEAEREIRTRLVWAVKVPLRLKVCKFYLEFLSYVFNMDKWIKAIQTYKKFDLKIQRYLKMFERTLKKSSKLLRTPTKISDSELLCNLFSFLNLRNVSLSLMDLKIFSINL